MVKKQKHRANSRPSRQRARSRRSDSSATAPNVPNRIAKTGEDLADDAAELPQRNAAVDTLRGLAVVLMVIDHIAAYWFDVRIEIASIRFATRLSMPLFCVLLGYFIPSNWEFRFKRYGQIFAAGIMANAIYWPLNHEFEILASLLAAGLVGTSLGPAAPIMMLSILAYPTDPLASWLDYQLTLVFPLVAQGIILRRIGWKAAAVAGLVLLVMTLSGRWIQVTDTHRFVVWYLIPATVLLAMAQRWPDWQIRWLAWMGRHPLTIYVLHFYIIAAVMLAS
ncbi:MAG: acyltransferase family protein [Planctomycetota bacterium]